VWQLATDEHGGSFGMRKSRPARWNAERPVTN
jgi:hypothetical protein